MSLIEFFEKIPKTPNDMVFFDIDDTLLRPYYSKPVPVKRVVDFYQYLINNNYNVSIITARPYFEENLKYTVQDLESIGIDKTYKYLIMRPPENNDIKSFKRDARKYVIEQGYTPLMSIGDMMWDTGDYGGIGIIVFPNNE